MIQENEIRIGNWFYHKPDVWSYRNEDGKGGEFQWTAQDWYALGECTLDLEAIEPLDLNHKALIAFAFKLMPNSSYYHKYYSERHYLSFSPRYDYIEICVNMICGGKAKCKYIHHIQNLWTDLTGEELTKIEKG
jgi:hypothetical protein